MSVETVAVIDTPTIYDVEAMAALRVDYFREVDEAKGEEPRMPYDVQQRIEEAFLPSYLTQPTMVLRVARAGHEVVGMLYGFRSTSLGGLADLRFLTIAAPHRGQGIGTRLVESFTDASGAHSDVVLTAAGPDPAGSREFYKTLHFVHTGGGRMVRSRERVA